MVENPEFLALLDRHDLKHDISPESRVEIAVRMLSRCGSSLDAYLLAFGDIPETFKQFMSIINFVNNEQDEGLKSLYEAFTELNKAGKTIYPPAT